MRAFRRPLIAIHGLFAALGFAAVAPRVAFDEMVHSADEIVQGKVTRSWMAWDNSHKYIWTHYEVRTTDLLKGRRSTTVVVSEPGGNVDGIYQQASGSVSYGIGEDVVLFLYRTPIGYMRTIGGGQGKLTVSANGRVFANTQGLVFVAPNGTSAPPAPEAVANVSIRELKARIRTLLHTGGNRENKR